jgi:hypothetical protein
VAGAESQAEDFSVGSIVDGIEKAFSAWKPTEQRASKYLWKLLGQIFEADCAIEGDAARKEELIDKARKHEEIRKSNRWNASEKRTHDILLTMLLGLSQSNIYRCRHICTTYTQPSQSKWTA